MKVAKFFVAKASKELEYNRLEFEKMLLDFSVHSCYSTYDRENKIWITFVMYDVREVL